MNVTQGAYGLNTVSHERFTELGKKFNLNMADHFKPTAENYFNHMPKSALIEFLGETGLEGKKKKGLLATIASDRVEANWSKHNKYVPKILHTNQASPVWPFLEEEK